MMRSGELFLLVALAGCADQPCPSGRHRITVSRPGNSTLVAYRDGATDWTTLEPFDAGLYNLCVADDYVFLDVCDDGYAFEMASTVAETSSMVDLGPCPTRDLPAGSVKVTTHVDQPGLYTLGSVTYFVSSVPVTLELTALPGMRDLVATSAYEVYGPAVEPRVLLRRDRVIQGPGSLADIVLSGPEATPMDVVPVSIDGLDATDHLVSNHVSFQTKNGTNAWIASVVSTDTPLIPASLLIEGDTQQVELRFASDTGNRTVLARYTAGPLAFTLPPKLTGLVSYMDGTASWSTLPPYTALELDLFGASSTEHIRASAGWLAKYDSSRLSFVRGGGLSDVGAPTSRANFTLYEDVGDVTYTSIIGL